MNHGLDNDHQVFFYEQDFYVLSNFSAFTLQWDGRRFDTSEAAYHYEKFQGRPSLQELIRTAPSAHEAFWVARNNRRHARPDWDDCRLVVMLEILWAKVSQHEYVRRKLLATGDRQLIENSWRDSFWGWGEDRKGENWLGALWMRLRGNLRAGDPPPVTAWSNRWVQP